MGSFLCDENIIDDRKIQKLITEFGESAGFIFIRLLAHVKKAQESCHIIFTSSQWFRKFVAEGVTSLETIKKIFSKLADLELIDPYLYKGNIIFLPNYIKRHANYFKQLQRRDSYSGKNLRARLRSGFDDREKKGSFSISFEDFVLLIEQKYLGHGIELRMSTDNQEIAYIQENVRLRHDRETRICTSTSTDNIYNQNSKILKKEKVYLQPSPEPTETDKWCDDMTKLIYQHAKSIDPGYEEPNFKEWWQVFNSEKMQKRGRGEIEKVLRFALQDEFWSGKVFSPQELDKHYPKLKSDMMRTKGVNINKSSYTYMEVLELTTNKGRDWEDFKTIDPEKKIWVDITTQNKCFIN